VGTTERSILVPGCTEEETLKASACKDFIGARWSGVPAAANIAAGVEGKRFEGIHMHVRIVKGAEFLQLSG
jgi:hypothetical protein